MRRGVAALLLVIVAALFAIDPLACPDGCTNDRLASHAATAAGSGCALCQNGVSVRASVVYAAPAFTVRRITSLRIEFPRSAPPADIDHPPRAS